MKKLILSLCVMLFAAAAAFAASDNTGHSVQMNVPEVVLIDVSSGDPIVLDITEPAQGGLAPTGDTDATLYLWYTAINEGIETRTITIQWAGGDAAPAGTHLKAEAISVSAGAGTAFPGGRTVSNMAQTLVTAIPSCVTGQAANGANIEYELVVDDATLLKFDDGKTATITFTLTEGA